MKKTDLLLFIFSTILAVHLVYPLFTEIVYWKIILVLSVIIILMLLIQMPRVKKFESPIVDAEFYEENIKGESVDPEIKKETEEITKSAPNRESKFIEMVIEIEKRLREIASDLELPEKRGTFQLVSELESEEIIDSSTKDLFINFWNARNEVVHGQRKLTSEEYKMLINISKVFLTRLENISQE